MLFMIISDQVIEEIEWSPDGSLIIIGVTEGILYVVDAQSTESLFSFVSEPCHEKTCLRGFRPG